jgi:phenylacetic acid degradation protein paaN
MTASLFNRHEPILTRALTAIRQRGYWSPYAESPDPHAYGDSAQADGHSAFQALRGADFRLRQSASDGWVGGERSPFGFDLGVRYPHADLAQLLTAAKTALPAWRDAGPRPRAGVCLEILDRLNRRSFEMAHAVMHTTGQAFVMAFQAGGPQAQDRGLEAVAYAYDAMTRHAASARWEKPAGKRTLVMDKEFHIVPRGLSLVVGCSTFPNWNSYPGLFASLVTGNPVLVKPHPRAMLPLALTVQIGQDVLAEAGFAPELLALVAEAEEERLASVLATHPAVRIIDFTGSSEYGNWLERNAPQAQVYTEKAGVNTIVVDSTDDFAGMCRNISFSLSLYSGQMCTAPQAILVPRDGIVTDQGPKSYRDVAAGIAAGIESLTADPARAVEVLGAIGNPSIIERIEQASDLGSVVLASRPLSHPTFPDAVVRTPVLLAVDADERHTYDTERFGPISFAVATDDTAASLALMREVMTTRGALTASVYSTDDKVIDAAREVVLEVGVALSENLTGGVFVNQSAAFSDFHATGANPAANASLTDDAFVAGRFRIVQVRRPA